MVAITIVNYGLFNSNSGGHVAHFANELAALGETVFVLGANDPDSALDFGPRRFVGYCFDEIERDLPVDLIDAMRSPGSVVHAWTPREVVRRTSARIVDECGCAYIVHLEDDEEVVTGSLLGRPYAQLEAMTDQELDSLVPLHLMHPRRGKSFLAEAAGVTVIVEALRSFVGDACPTLVLEPGVDVDLFAPDMDPAERQQRRRDLFIPDHAWVIVYHGNMHPANEREIFSLYTAMMILERRGRDVRLIRTGKDYTTGLDQCYEVLAKRVIALGYVDREELIRTLKLADAYVQPGSIDAFNAHRLPSKVPEFLALGRPVLMPRTNIGLKLSDEQAVRLPRGLGVDIADALEALMDDPGRAKKLGTAGRAFAVEHLDWQANTKALQQFYRDVEA